MQPTQCYLYLQWTAPNWTELLNLLGPLHFEDEMIVAESWHSRYRFGCVLTSMEVNERKSLEKQKQQY